MKEQRPQFFPLFLAVYTWSRLYEEGCIPKTENGVPYCEPMPATIFAFYYLIMNFFIFGVLTWYLDQVLPAVHGESRPVYFPFMPSYWGFALSKKKEGSDENSPLLSAESSQVNSDSDEAEGPEDPVSLKLTSAFESTTNYLMNH